MHTFRFRSFLFLVKFAFGSERVSQYIGAAISFEKSTLYYAHWLELTYQCRPNLDSRFLERSKRQLVRRATQSICTEYNVLPTSWVEFGGQSYGRWKYHEVMRIDTLSGPCFALIYASDNQWNLFITIHLHIILLFKFKCQRDSLLFLF